MNFGRFGKIASVSLIGAMLLAGCSGNGQTVMKIGDTNITEGAVNFFANYGMGTEDVDAAVDNLKQEYLLKEVAKAMDITLTDDEAKALFQILRLNRAVKKPAISCLKSTVLMMI